MVGTDREAVDEVPDGQLHTDGFARWTLSGVPPRPDRIPYLRHQIGLVLTRWKLQQALYTVELVISELATNVLRHAHTPFTVTMLWDGTTLHGEVIDVNPGAPRPNPEPALDQLGGRGLLLVEQLVSTWGWGRHGQGKSVYFDMHPGVDASD